MSDSKQAILSVMIEGREYDVASIVRTSNVSDSAVRQCLKGLIEGQIVDKTKVGRKSFYSSKQMSLFP